MNTASVIVLIIVCIIAAAAVFGIIRSRKKGGCGDCGSCPYSDTCKEKRQ